MSKLNYTQLYLCACIIAALSLFINLEHYTNYLLLALAIAVVTLGLPHGALDFGVAKSLKLVNSFTSTISFLTVYLLITAFAIAFWIWQPGIALVIFFAISILHFSADWRDSLPQTARICLATAVICGPSLIHASVVSGIFMDLLLSDKASAFVILGMRILFISSIAFLASFALYALFKKKYSNAWQMAEWSILLLSSVTLNPLLHFGLYFCLLHSPKHLHDVSELLNTSVKKTLVLSLPFVILTLVLAVALYLWLGSGVLSIDLLRWVFIGLFGLTTSHMMLISIWHSSKRRR